MIDLKEKYDKNNNRDCALIIIYFLLQNMQNTIYDSSNLVALEIVKCLSYELDDITKLKLIIPYFVENLKRGLYNKNHIPELFIRNILFN